MERLIPCHGKLYSTNYIQFIVDTQGKLFPETSCSIQNLKCFSSGPDDYSTERYYWLMNSQILAGLIKLSKFPFKMKLHLIEYIFSHVQEKITFWNQSRGSKNVVFSFSLEFIFRRLTNWHPFNIKVGTLI